MISLKPVKNSVVYVVLKAAWAAYGSVVMTDLEEGVMAFDFQNVTERDRILDMSPWVIHGHCLNLKVANPNNCNEDIDFGRISVWAQVHGLSSDIINGENVAAVAAMIGSCLDIDKENDMQRRGYLRLKVDINTGKPLLPSFWWTAANGQEKWANIRYERLSDFCYGCGVLGHSAQVCNSDIVTSETNPGKPMYGP